MQTQFALQPNNLISGLDNPTIGSMKDIFMKDSLIAETRHPPMINQMPFHPPLPNNTQPYFPSMSLPPREFIPLNTNNNAVWGQQPNSAPRMFVPLNNFQSHPTGQQNSNLLGPSQNFYMPPNPISPGQLGQQPNHYPYDININSFTGNRNGEGRRNFSEEYQNRPRKDNQYNSRNEKNERGNRNINEKYEKRDFNSNRGSGRNAESSNKDRRPSHRSRSRSRSYERKDSTSRKGSYSSNSSNKERVHYSQRKGSKDDDNGYSKGKFSQTKNKEDLNDWKCVDCGNVNWARRELCNRCRVKKPENPLIVVDII